MPELPSTTLPAECPDAEWVRLRAENAALRAQVVEQAAQIAELLLRVQELEARLAKDSHNSSKPPSSDPPFKKPPPRTLRQRSGKKPGGQKDHPGTTLALVADPEHTVTIPLVGRCTCGQDLSALPIEELPERRQLADLVVRREVTEYRTVRGLCACGQVHRSPWPGGVEAPVQYGPGVAAIAVYLTHYQQLPYQRTAELLGGVGRDRPLAGHALRHGARGCGATERAGGGDRSGARGECPGPCR